MFEDYNLYWGDSHCNLRIYHEDRFESAFTESLGRIDFFPVAYYPFDHMELGSGLDVETVRNRPLFLEQWKTINELTARYNRPGEFVTFPGYEWHGNREKWGDHNVFFPSEGAPLLDTWDLPDLVRELRRYGAVAFPHHVAYLPGERGKDWSFHDPDICPLVEIFSAHGCSESDDSPLPLMRNTNMGPRTSGGAVVDGLLKGHRFGIIASNDSHHAYPGCWGLGLMALYAKDLTREGLMEAIRSRRAYGVTGDRMRVEFSVEDLPMGREAIEKGSGPVRAAWKIDACDALDRVELIRNGRVIQAYQHLFDPSEFKGGRMKVRLETGWGPDKADGFEWDKKQWKCAVNVDGGKVLSVEPCFKKPANYATVENDAALINFTNYQRDTSRGRTAGEQAAIVELNCPADGALRILIAGREHRLTPQELLSSTRLYAQMDEVKELVQKQFGVDEENVVNPDVYYHNAWKYRIHRAVPQAGLAAEGEFVDEQPPAGESFYYLRAFQRNGQAAWTSPIWIKR